MNINITLTYLVRLLDIWPGLKTKLAAVASALSALIVAISVVMTAFDVGFTIPYLNEINAFLIALTAAGAANAQARLSSK